MATETDPILPKAPEGETKEGATSEVKSPEPTVTEIPPATGEFPGKPLNEDVPLSEKPDFPPSEGTTETSPTPSPEKVDPPTNEVTNPPWQAPAQQAAEPAVVSTPITQETKSFPFKTFVIIGVLLLLVIAAGILIYRII